MKNEEKIFKNHLKGKIRITAALIISFLISGNLAMAIESSSPIKYPSNGKSYVIQKGQNPVGEPITVIDNNIINGKGGILVGEDTTNTLELNSNVGNGILSYTNSSLSSKAINITKFSNSGIISGTKILDKSTDLSNAGNGVALIAVENSVIVNESALNRGKIIGNLSLKQGAVTLANTGNGIILEGQNTKINLQNNGVIEAKGENIYSTSGINNVGNGVIISGKNSANNEIINNRGIISSNINLKDMNEKLTISGNGVAIKETNVKAISNSGIIRGNAQGNPSSLSNSSGNGIYVDDIENLNNTGIIIGNNAALSLGSTTGFNVANGGVMVGNKIYLSGNNTSTPTLNSANQGIYLSGNDEINGKKGQATIVIGSGGQIDGKNILNGSTNGIANAENKKNNQENSNPIIVGSGENIKDVYIKTASLKGQNENVIINGTGIKKAALYVDSNLDLVNSTVNAYGTAIEIDSGKKLSLGDTIVNGGGLDGAIDIIKGNVGNNVLEIYGASTINGNINLGAGDDILTIGNSVQLNGTLSDTLGNDTLNLGKKEITKNSSDLTIYNNISGFENVNTNGNVTLLSSAKVSGANNIDLQTGNLYLQFNPYQQSNDGILTGHALYENSGKITSNGGNLVLGVTNLKDGTVIGMGKTSIDNKLIENKHLLVNSQILDAKVNSDNKIIVNYKPDLPVTPDTPNIPSIPGGETTPDNPSTGGGSTGGNTSDSETGTTPNKPLISTNSLLYNKLNRVYHSIITAKLTLNNLGIVSGDQNAIPTNDPNEINKLLTLTNQIYANTPYVYTLKSSRDGLKLFEDNMEYLTVKPLQGQSIVQGKAIYTGVKNDSSYSGNDYYGADKGNIDYRTTTNTVGGIGTYEYGISNNTSIGLAIGGNHQKVNFKGASDIKANSLYIGTFAKKEINNFKLKTGVGYQYTSAKGERSITNGYQSFNNNDRYDINGLNAFAEIKYSIKAGDSWLFEPKAKISYYYLRQQEVKENYDPNTFAIKVDKTNSNTADIEIGADFVKEISLEKSKIKNIISVGVINTIGEKDKELKANIIGPCEGSQFEMAGVKLPKTSGKVSYNLEVEAQSGMIYSAGISMEFAKDYNRNINTTLGVGYKF